MPLPFILAGAAIAAGAFGIKKGLDAKSDMDKAKRVTESANEIGRKAQARLENQQEDTKAAVEGLGRTKIEILSGSVNDFINNFKKIKNINLRETEGIKELKHLNMSQDDFSDLEASSFQASQVAVNGLSSVGAGALMAYGTYSAVGLLGVASTGTAIGGLSGVAATNATLAWLGGGALSAGGFGIAGGMAVLGGLVAGPALAIGGSIFASKAKTALNDAYSNRDKAELFKTQVKKICTEMRGISRRAEQLEELLNDLNQLLVPSVDEMKAILQDTGTNWQQYTVKQKKEIGKCVLLAQAIKKVLDTKLLTDDGVLTEESIVALQQGQHFLLEHS